MNINDILHMRVIARAHFGYVNVYIKGFINHDEKCLYVIERNYIYKPKIAKVYRTVIGRLYFRVRIDRKIYRVYIDECERV